MIIGVGIGLGVLLMILGVLIFYCIGYKQRRCGGYQGTIGRYPNMSFFRRSRTQRENIQHDRPPTVPPRRDDMSSGMTGAHAYDDRGGPSTSEDIVSPRERGDIFLSPNYLEPRMDSGAEGYYPKSHKHKRKETRQQHRDNHHGDHHRRDHHHSQHRPDYYHDNRRHREYYEQKTGNLQFESYFKSHEVHRNRPDQKKKPKRPLSQYISEEGVKLFRSFTGAQYHRGRHN